MSYDLSSYLAMIEDDVRTPRYLEALRAVIRPGDRVLELGTGVGFFAIAAVRAGAAHVFAVEPNDAIQHGRALAAANGCSDRITFIQAHAENLTLDAPCDVLLEDLRGISPLHGSRIAVLRDARRRLLTPDARAIPLRDALIVAPSELPDDLPRLAPDAPASRHGIDLAPLTPFLSLDIHRTRGGPGLLLAGPATWATLDYRDLPAGDPEGALDFEVTRDGKLAGFMSWFATTLAEGIGYETGPERPRTVYDRGFLPIGAPVPVRRGDRVQLTLRTRFDGAEHAWVWETTIENGRSNGRRLFSNFASRLMSPARRARRDAAYVPPADRHAARLARLGQLVDGQNHLSMIAARLWETEGLGFASYVAALAWASALLARADEEPLG